MQLSQQQFPTSSLSSPVSSVIGLYDDVETWYDDVKDFSDGSYALSAPELLTVKSEDYDDEQVESVESFSPLLDLSSITTPDIASQSLSLESVKRICLVCGDVASGLHYGIASCEACKAFFKRTVQGHIEYVCPASGQCEMTRKRRKACQACRYNKCLEQGMNPEGIRPDRSKGGRYKMPRSGVNGDLADHSSIVSSHMTQNNSAASQKLLLQLLRFEPQTVYAAPDASLADCADKTMVTLSKLADRELVATVAWAKQVPGFSVLALADQMTLLQKTWLDILYLNFAYRSATNPGILVFSEDFKLSSDDIEQFGIPPELCTSLLLLAKKLSSLALSVEEYVLLKAIVLLNPDVDVMSPMSVESARHDVFDALLMYTRSQGCRRGRRVSDVLLALPLLTRLVSAGCEFWRQTKARGHVTAHRLLSEMVDRILTSL